jgi:hypothetical protein
MKRALGALIVIFMGFFPDPFVWADMIRMKNGQVIEGKYLGGTEYTVRFQTDDGIVDYQVEQILTLTFLPITSPLFQKTPTPQTTQTPQPEQQELTIASNTRLSVRMLDSLNTGMSRKDDWFDATLKSDLVVNGVVVAPKGTMVRGQVLKSERGKYGSALVITLRQLLLKQQTVPITTTNYGMWDRLQETSEATKPLRRSRFLEIPSQTVLELKTTAPVTIDLSK